MALPTYTNIPDTDVDVGSPIDEDLMTELRDNIEANRVTPIPWNIPSTVVTSASYVQVGTDQLVYVPNLADYTGIVRRLVGYVDCTAITGGTGDVYIYETVEALTGGSVSVSAVQAYQPASATITTAPLPGTLKFQLWARKNGGGSMTIGAPFTVAASLEY